jgi:hypothetical protein
MIQNHWHYVTNSEAAQTLLHPETFKNFAVFLGVEQSLTSAAKILKQPASSLKYHLEKFIEWGLVSQTRTEPRRGKPIKYYQAVSDQFFISFANTKHETMTKLIQSMQIPLIEQYCTDFVRAGFQIRPEAIQGGMCIRALENQRYSIDFSATPPPQVEINPHSMKPLWNSWTTIHLTTEQANNLHHEITQLWSRVIQENAQAQENTRSYTLHLGFTPQP